MIDPNDFPEEVLLLDCLGIDDKIHFCKSDSDKTLCGIPVKRKKIQDKEWSKFYSCSECRW